MILKEEVAVVLSGLLDWARRNHVSAQAEKIINETVRRLVTKAREDGRTDQGDAVKEFVGELLMWAESYGYGQQAETALTELGHGALIPPKSGLFDVSFAGVTLRLTLPINRRGQAYGVHGAVDRAVEEAIVTPVVPAESADVLPEPTDDLDH